LSAYISIRREKMAMQNVQKNLASEMQSLAADFLRAKNRLAVVIAMYASESMATLADADYAALDEFSHVTVTEMTAAKNALGEINTAMGEYVAGTAVTRLMRIVNAVPK
jgi:hypothetical protein